MLISVVNMLSRSYFIFVENVVRGGVKALGDTGHSSCDLER